MRLPGRRARGQYVLCYTGLCQVQRLELGFPQPKTLIPQGKTTTSPSITKLSANEDLLKLAKSPGLFTACVSSERLGTPRPTGARNMLSFPCLSLREVCQKTICLCMYVCMHACVHAGMYVCMYVYVWMDVCMDVMYVYIYI